MQRYRHFKNVAEGGQLVFVTTTVLDFVPIFRTKELADRMVELLFEVHGHYGAIFHGYSVMPDHIHFVTRLPADKDVSTFVKNLKSYTAKQLLPQIPPEIDAMFATQRGLNQLTLWQVSFRSFPIESDEVFWQKIKYMHENPVRRGLCLKETDYPWSSVHLHEAGRWNSESGLMTVAEVMLLLTELVAQRASTGGPVEA